MRKFISLLAALGMCLSLSAEVTFHKDEVAGGYDFVLFIPDSVASPAPLIVSLHSRGASGKNLQDVDHFGTIDAIQSGMNVDAIVLAPQATGDKWDVEKVMKDIRYVIDSCNVDTNRVYAIGMSMGGNGVADMVAAHPDRFSAAIILAGGLTAGNPAALSQVPLWVIRGLKDREEAIYRTDDMVKNIRKADGLRIAYSRVKGLDHRQHERILYMSYFYEWLLSHNLAAEGRPLSPTIDVKAKMLDDAYKGLNLREGSAALRKSRGNGPRRPRGPRRW